MKSTAASENVASNSRDDYGYSYGVTGSLALDIELLLIPDVVRIIAVT